MLHGTHYCLSILAIPVGRKRYLVVLICLLAQCSGSFHVLIEHLFISGEMSVPILLPI